MLVTTRRIAAAKPQVIEGYLKTMVEAIAVTLDPANKELVMRLQAVEPATHQSGRCGGILSCGH